MPGAPAAPFRTVDVEPFGQVIWTPPAIGEVVQGIASVPEVPV